MEAELTDELDGCIITVLVEYAKLFLEPGANVRRGSYSRVGRGERTKPRLLCYQKWIQNLGDEGLMRFNTD